MPAETKPKTFLDTLNETLQGGIKTNFAVTVANDVYWKLFALVVFSAFAVMLLQRVMPVIFRGK